VRNANKIKIKLHCLKLFFMFFDLITQIESLLFIHFGLSYHTNSATIIAVNYTVVRCMFSVSKPDPRK
jgi:hypothetical protein